MGAATGRPSCLMALLVATCTWVHIVPRATTVGPTQCSGTATLWSTQYLKHHHTVAGPLITRSRWHPNYPLNFPLPWRKWGEMGEMGEKGEKGGGMEQNGENIGKLVEEDGKNIQLPPRWQKFCKHEHQS